MSEKPIDLSVNFLDGFMRLNENTEIPSVFSLWSGIAGISCALGRRVWVDMGRYQIYPNTYVLLVAGSGRMRKSTSVMQIAKLINNVEPRPNLVSQKITPQAFVEAMKTAPGVGEQGVLVETATGFGFIYELATFLDRAAYDAGLAPLLIDFFDCHEHWEYRTKGRGIENLHNVCFGFLAASTIDWIKKGIPIEAIGGGLTSRMVFVYAEHDSSMKPVPMTVYTPEEKALNESLLRKLQRIATLKGQVDLSKEAIDYYIDSYTDWYYRSGLPYYDDPLLSGYASRRYIHMFKLGMIFAAAAESVTAKGSLLITQQHLEGAIMALRLCESHMKTVVSQIMTSEDGEDTSRVLHAIKRSGTISRSDLTTAFSHKFNSRKLTEILETLVHGGRVQLLAGGGQGVVYKFLK